MIDLASRNYEAGEIIVACTKPLIQSTKYEHRPFTCDHCMMKVNRSLPCQKCLKVYYCDVKCLNEHFETIHQYECDILSRHQPMKFETNGLDYMQRLSLRLYLLLKRSPELLEKKFYLHNGLSRTILEMESHSREISSTQQFKGILNYFKFYQINDFDSELLLKVYGILQCNAFGIDSYDGTDDNDRDVIIESRASGLYIEASVFDHDCVPNACASGDGLKLEIRALKSIAKGDKITIDYLQDVIQREERQKLLSERYFFTCQCLNGCKDGLKEAFDSKVDYKKLKILNDLIAKLMENFKQATSQELISTGISDQNILSKLLRKENKFDNWERLLDFWKKRLEIQEVFYSKAQHHPCLSLFYREFLLLNVYLIGQQNLSGDRSQFGLLDRTTIERDIVRFGEKAKMHLSITHGIEHIFYSKLFSPNQQTFS